MISKIILLNNSKFFNETENNSIIEWNGIEILLLTKKSKK